MTNPDPKSGGWSVYEVLGSAPMNLLRTAAVQSIDGVGGGTYTPSSTIQIEGANGITIAGTGSGARLRYSSRSIERIIPPHISSSTNWTLPDSPHLWTTNTTSAGDRLFWTLTGIPNASVLTGLTLRFQGATGGTVPATPPRIQAFKVAGSTGTETALFAEFDDPTVAVSNAAYVATHDIAKTGLSETWNSKNNWYYLIVRTPGGGGTATGATIKSLTATVTLTDQSEWEG